MTDKPLPLQAKNIIRILEEKGMERSALAKRLGKDPQAISRALSPDAPSPTVKTLEEYARGLEVDVSELLRPEKGGSTQAVTNSRLSVLGEIVAILTSLEENQLRQALVAVRGIQDLGARKQLKGRLEEG